jgi:hypothetical protein
MRIIQLPPPRTGRFAAVSRLWAARSDLDGLPALKQVRAMARHGGVSPRLHPFNPRASYVPEEVRDYAACHRGHPALFYTRSWKGCWVDVAAFRDGTNLVLLK